MVTFCSAKNVPDHRQEPINVNKWKIDLKYFTKIRYQLLKQRNDLLANMEKIFATNALLLSHQSSRIKGHFTINHKKSFSSHKPSLLHLISDLICKIHSIILHPNHH